MDLNPNYLLDKMTIPLCPECGLTIYKNKKDHKYNNHHLTYKQIIKDYNYFLDNPNSTDIIFKINLCTNIGILLKKYHKQANFKKIEEFKTIIHNIILN